MKIEYFVGTDTLQITFSERAVVETTDVNESTLLEFDADGLLVTMTVEHAGQRAEMESFSYKKYPADAALAASASV